MNALDWKSLPTWASIGLLATPVVALPGAAQAGTPDPSVESAAPGALGELHGRYILVEDSEQAQAQIDAAIEAAIERVPALFRGYARELLRAKNPLMREVAIEAREGEIRVRFSEDVVYASPADGTSQLTRAPDGERVRLSQQLRQGRLEQVFASKDGRRINRFRLSSDGNALLLEVEVRSQRLPESVRYSLRFERSQTRDEPAE